MPLNKKPPLDKESSAPPNPSLAAKAKGTPNPHRPAGTRKFPKEVMILYEAIKYGTTEKIDHGAVAAAVGISAAAARMRHLRLMRKIEASVSKAPKNGVDGEREEASLDTAENQD